MNTMNGEKTWSIFSSGNTGVKETNRHSCDLEMAEKSQVFLMLKCLLFNVSFKVKHLLYVWSWITDFLSYMPYFRLQVLKADAWHCPMAAKMHAGLLASCDVMWHGYLVYIKLLTMRIVFFPPSVCKLLQTNVEFARSVCKFGPVLPPTQI